MTTEVTDNSDVRYHQSDASLFSKATLWWMNGLLFDGYRQPLEMSDLGAMPSVSS